MKQDFNLNEVIHTIYVCWHLESKIQSQVKRLLQLLTLVKKTGILQSSML